MKKFWLKILLLIIILIPTDRILGKLFNFFLFHSKGGQTEKMVYIADKMNEKILILGSSRAFHHYNPQIIEDSLQMSCYNCGQDGNGIIFSYGLFKLFTRRYTPKIIIYDVVENYDINQGENVKFLSWLRYFYNRPGIDSIFFDIDKTEKYKMLSYMRRYNERFLQIISDYYNPKTQFINGYSPLNGIMNYEPNEINNNINNIIQYDSTKSKYLKKLIKECKDKNIKLIFMISPKYNGGNNNSYESIAHLARTENIPFLYHYNDKEISYNKKYFEDSFHMNKFGADFYTRKIINDIRGCIAKED